MSETILLTTFYNCLNSDGDSDHHFFDGTVEMTQNPRTELQVVDRVRMQLVSDGQAGDCPEPEPEPEPRELDALAEAYREGGRSALAAWTGDPREWLYWRLVTTTDATHDSLLHERVLPLLAALVQADTVDNWWFLRKPHGGPHLRLRLHPAPRSDLAELTSALVGHFESWRQEGELLRCSRLVYEPEVSIFGGAGGMELAHELFWRDSVGYCRSMPVLSARGFQFSAGVSAALLAGCFQGAGLDWFEQGDVWRIVGMLRAATLPESVTEADAKPVARLRSIFAGADAVVAEAASDLPELAEWHLAFKELGRGLADADGRGDLEIGLRRIIAVHVVFHWNRMGFGFAQQALLAQCARKATSWAA
jgi:thiopeptide-type bacteriocin biosynthesis protein